MENASKALIMAGGVLIGILVLGMVMFSYQKLVEMANQEHDKTYEEQQKNYNALWEKYNGSIYGTDVMSMVNQMADYNRTEADEEGYVPIRATITIRTTIEATALGKSNVVMDCISVADAELLKGTYSAQELYEKFRNLDTVTKTQFPNLTMKINGKYVKISKLVNMRKDKTKSEYEIDDDGYDEVRKEVDAYLEVQNILKDIKNKKFTASVEYDTHNGRVTNIQVTEKT